MEKTIIVICLLLVPLGIISISPVFAIDTQVYIKNNTSTKECSYATCFLPYQVTISLGDSVTWTNLDNKTHTVTAGSRDTGPVGNFDSGYIAPGKSFKQFFGTIGKYQYFDITNPWVAGIVMVQAGKPLHAELAWVNGSLNLLDKSGNNMSIPIVNKPVTITKNVINSGGTDASSITFRLQIKNGTNFLVYDNLAKADIGVKQSVPISFSWLPEKSGIYHLFFDADPSNTIGDTNENNDISFDSLIVFNGTVPTNKENVYKIYNNTTTPVPEFGSLAPILLAASTASIIILSSKLKFLNLRNK
jgi:plastocyanin